MRWPGLFHRLYCRTQFVSETGCWEYCGAKNPGGYGIIRGCPQTYLAHRVAWILDNGPIPQGVCVCHTCDNPSCINPAHLWLGTRADNNRDKEEKGRAVYHPGEKNGGAKLTEEQVYAIRKDNRIQIEIAAEYGCDQTTVSEIKRRKTWASLPEEVV